MYYVPLDVLKLKVMEVEEGGYVSWYLKDM